MHLSILLAHLAHLLLQNQFRLHFSLGIGTCASLKNKLSYCVPFLTNLVHTSIKFSLFSIDTLHCLENEWQRDELNFFFQSFYFLTNSRNHTADLPPQNISKKAFPCHWLSCFLHYFPKYSVSTKFSPPVKNTSQFPLAISLTAYQIMILLLLC